MAPALGGAIALGPGGAMGLIETINLVLTTDEIGVLAIGLALQVVTVLALFSTVMARNFLVLVRDRAVPLLVYLDGGLEVFRIPAHLLLLWKRVNFRDFHQLLFSLVHGRINLITVHNRHRT